MFSFFLLFVALNSPFKKDIVEPFTPDNRGKKVNAAELNFRPLMVARFHMKPSYRTEYKLYELKMLAK